MTGILDFLAKAFLWCMAIGFAVMLVWFVVGNVGGAVRRDAQTRRDGKPGFVPVTWTKPRKGN